MFAPTKTWRKWHVKVPQGQRRFATASALAASATVPLVQARGHRVSEIAELPLVIASAAFNDISKTRAAVALLKTIGAYTDVVKVAKSRKTRAGKGKLRDRRHRQRRGPLVIFNPADETSKNVVKAFRNIPGVETCSVNALNLLQLAPGGHLGRFVIWTESAFGSLNTIYGSTTEAGEGKKNYFLPSNVVSQADLTRLINSSEIQTALRPIKGAPTQKKGGKAGVLKKNPLKNKQVMLRLNPYAKAFSAQKLGQQKVEGSKERPGLSETFQSVLNSA
jgi:large subunit ribosomal protein L4e